MADHENIGQVANGQVDHARRNSHEAEPKPVSIHHEEFLELEERTEHPERVLIANPLRNRSREEVIHQARQFRRDHDLRDVIDKGVFVRGALAAQNPDAIRDIPGITRLEIVALERERNLPFWGQMKDLTREFIQILTTCCTAAIVQGWDQSSINGANLRWPPDLGLSVDLVNPNQNSRNVWIFGIVNAASYFSAAIIGSQLSDPLNEYAFGRRGALFIAAAFSFATVIAAAYVQSWQALLGMRILLGIGIGAKASVVAVYIAETCPSRLRGSLIIFWQMFVACGIFLGDAANLVVLDKWRWQVASPFIPAIPLMVLVWFCYESPRWLYKHNNVKSALNSLRHLRKSDILACRDLFLMHEQLQGEIKYFLKRGDEEQDKSLETPTEMPTSAQAQADAGAWDTEDDLEAEIDLPGHIQEGNKTPTWGSRLQELRNIYMPRQKKKAVKAEDYHIEIRNTTYFQRYRQLFIRPHIRATTAAACVMAAQQLCGVNILAFLSSTIFADALTTGDPEANALVTTGKITPSQEEAQKKALWMSFGFGVSNFVFTFLAWGTIDYKGRRWLLNLSFPGTALMLLGMGLCFLIPHGEGRLAAIETFAILYVMAYAPGLGPVPFTASAEMFPLFIREVGMSFAVFINLFGAGIIALVTPFLAQNLSHPGLLGLFTGLDLIAWLLCYLFYPETARISLEELRAVFDVPLGAQARYRFAYLKYLFKSYISSRWTREYVEEPDPIHIWWRDQPKTHDEKKEYQELHKKEKKARKEEQRRERDELKRAKRAPRVDDDRDAHAQERQRWEEEMRQARQREAELSRQLQELKEAQLRQRSDRESEAGGGVSSTTSLHDAHEHHE